MRRKVALFAAIGIAALFFVLYYRCSVDERRARDELLAFGQETWQVARWVNRGGFVPPEVLVRPSAAQPDVHLLPVRFALERRGGYAFDFVGSDGAEDPKRPWKLRPSYRSFEFLASPVGPLCGFCRARYFLLSSETMAIHVSATVPTVDDPIVATTGDGVLEN